MALETTKTENKSDANESRDAKLQTPGGGAEAERRDARFETGGSGGGASDTATPSQNLEGASFGKESKQEASA